MTPVIVRNVVLGQGEPKICIPLMGKTERDVLGAARELQKLPADLVEWRADGFLDLRNPQALIRSLKHIREVLGEDMPILFTVRTKQEGGEAELSRDAYCGCCLAALEGEADLLDVEASGGEETVLELIQKAHERGKKVILSRHDFSQTPDEEEMLACLCRMQAWGADITKLAVMPQSPSDVLKLLSVTLAMKETHADRPFITMAMGKDGLISRLCGETFGSCLTFGCGARASAPGQMDARALRGVLDAVHVSLTSDAQGLSAAPGLIRDTEGASLAPKFLLPCHIFLVGFMGTGKSTIARVLSRRLGVERIEMDQRIVAQEGMEINEIFERYGQEYFRDRETQTLRELGSLEPRVVSCGGGIVLRKENIRLMQEMGKTVLLTALPETVLARVKKDNARPNLKGRKTVEGIRELMDQREDYYRRAAQITISTDKKTPDEIAEQVILSFSEKNS